MIKNKKYWLVAYFVSSVVYLFMLSNGGMTFEWVPKTTPIFILLLMIIKYLTGNVRLLMGLALLFSALGDILLTFKGLFLAGLGAFLVAQILYFVLFFSQSRLSQRGVMWLTLILVYTVGVGSYILPNAGELSFVIAVYLLAIAGMVTCAGFRHDSQFIWVSLGAFVFMVSDSLIAVNKFVNPFPHSKEAIMVSYYLAQFMIALGIIRHQQAFK